MQPLWEFTRHFNCIFSTYARRLNCEKFLLFIFCPWTWNMECKYGNFIVETYFGGMAIANTVFKWKLKVCDIYCVYCFEFGGNVMMENWNFTILLLSTSVQTKFFCRANVNLFYRMMEPGSCTIIMPPTAYYNPIITLNGDLSKFNSTFRCFWNYENRPYIYKNKSIIMQCRTNHFSFCMSFELSIIVIKNQLTWIKKRITYNIMYTCFNGINHKQN